MDTKVNNGQLRTWLGFYYTKGKIMPAKIVFYIGLQKHASGVITCNKVGLRALRKAIDILLSDETLVDHDSTKIINDVFLQYRRV